MSSLSDAGQLMISITSVPQQLVRLHDPVAIALLGQEELAVVGEIELLGVAGDQSIEVRLAPIGLGAQDAAEALGLLLARPEGARDLDEQLGVGQVEREVADF